ncbi:hypothetical protein BDY21DRAFT_21942 [Lineolata rhizophorae]|uniref:Uncharacterized protein n=1 Tax=Lineolata rhizophorae TaxID=578093 RepID=A0A6A6P2L8_9PEZI|nr:hypothetical protein BDY21DRAFT_21942 [Lineolata rhizophorae]
MLSARDILVVSQSLVITCFVHVFSQETDQMTSTGQLGGLEACSLTNRTIFQSREGPNGRGRPRRININILLLALRAQCDPHVWVAATQPQPSRRHRFSATDRSSRPVPLHLLYVVTRAILRRAQLFLSALH